MACSLCALSLAAGALVSGHQVAPPPALASSAAVEQTAHGTRPALPVVATFDGLGAGLHAGDTPPRNPSDDSLAVGPNHVFQIANSQLAIFTKQGEQFDTTGRLLFGPIGTHALFAGHGNVCGSRANGDAVVRYDQLAERWLVAMPIFRRAVLRSLDPRTTGATARPGEAARHGQAADPGAAARPASPPSPPPPGGPPAPDDASRAMCYAISAGPDPLGQYYRCVFERPLFPDYPRSAAWPDGYYLPTSTGDEVIQKHVCIVERAKMLKGLPATEQCLIVNGVNFLNNADLDGTALPPRGAPNIMMATGGTQLHHDIDDDGSTRGRCTWTGSSRPERRCRARARSKSRRTAISAAGSSRAACRSRAPIAGSMRRAKSSWRASCIATWAAASRSWPCTRWTRPREAAACGGTSFVSMRRATLGCLNRAPTPQTHRPVGWPARRWIARATSRSGTRSAARRTSRGSVLPRASRLIRPAS